MAHCGRLLVAHSIMRHAEVLTAASVGYICLVGAILLVQR